MRTNLLSCLFYFALSTLISAQRGHCQSDSMQMSPEFKFATLADQEVSSKDLKGKVIVLDFWSSDCNPCKKSMPQLEKFYQQYKNNPKVVLYCVNSGWETLEKAKNFASSKRSSFLFIPAGTPYDLPFAYDSGSATMKAFNLELNPSTVIIDSKFRVRVKHSAFIADFYDFLTKHVEEYLADK